MSVNEAITSGLLELYVLGLCSNEELALVNSLCEQYPEVRIEIEAIEQTLLQAAAVKQPGSGVKQALMSAINTSADNAARAQVIKLPDNQAAKVKRYQFGLAASLLLFVSSLVYNLMLQQRVATLNNELSDLYASKSYLAQEIKIQQASISSINQRLQIVTLPGIKSITLNGMNSLANRAAVVYWNNKTDEVYFNANGLPDSDDNKQYQLWAIVNGKPVDAGVIDLSGGSSTFQKMKAVKGASAFAVTIENRGGSQTPTLNTMCLLGNV